MIPNPKHDKRNKQQVIFYTYPKLVFIWPLILTGFLFYPFHDTLQPLLGWIYLMISLLVVLTISVDIERNHAAFWGVVFIAIFFLGMWLQNYEHFTLFGNIYRFFASLEVTYPRSFALALSILLLPPYLVMLLWSRIQHKWRITHNEFEHFSWGRADDSLARGAKRFRSTYPDLFELLLCGAGTLIVYSATGRAELRRIPHVPFLFFVRRRIDKLLEATAVTAYQDQEDILAAEESEAEESEFNGITGDDDTESQSGIGGNDPL
ncbi:hypothetical protein [Poriferisphaera sp. WC338]|uniref:hypothetical protein n=1 Tax=Poriferisphaera sp. WC338 TaxID=3425129 RepID=UPI003D818AE8